MAATDKGFPITGKSIYLRKVRPEDVNEDYHGWMNNPEVNRYMETRFTSQTMDEIRSYVAKMADKADEIFLAICLKDGDRHIGNIKLGPINKFHHFAYISLFIGEKSYWGKGIATEAISLVKDFAFEKLGLHRLMAGCYADNVSSARAFEKAGFQREGLEKEKWLCEGKYVDGLLLGAVNKKMKTVGR